MEIIPTVLLDRLAFLEANYQYELITKNDRPPQCLLLLGYVLPDDKPLLKRCLNVPLSLKQVNASSASFDYDIGQVNRRIELIQCTNPGIKALGAMTLNGALYDYTTTLQRLMSQVEGLQYLFTYNPHQDFPLECHLMELISHQLTLSRIHYELRDLNSALDIGFPDAVQDESLRERELTIKLAKKIDRIIQYLRNSNDIDPKIMRAISLLVSQLQRAPTDDIEGEIMNKESEISAFRTACEQWEVGAWLLANKPND